MVLKRGVDNMKSKYMNNADVLLIQKEGFSPIKDKDGQRIQYEGMKIVQKVMDDKLIIVELLDADRMSEENIRRKLEIAGKNLAQMGGTTVIAFQVFVFDSMPDENKLQLIRDGQMEDVYIRKYLPCLTIDLANNKVNKLFNLPIKVDGVEEVLSLALNMDDDQSLWVDSNESIVLETARETNYRTPGFLEKVPILTYGLIAINVLVWLVMNIYALVKGVQVQSLFTLFGAKENYLILNGEYWRFITPIFLHADIEHLVMNCLSLFVFGRIVEGMYGRKKFAFIYLTAGIMGSIASFMFSPSSAVGASGAIFGLMGALLYFSFESPELFKRYFGNSLILMVVINLVYGFIRPGIDNYGHIGGLVGGFLASGIVKIRKKPTKLLSRFVFITLTILLVSGCLYYGFNMSANAKYYKIDELEQVYKFDEAEKIGEEILDMSLLDENMKINTLVKVAMLECFQGKFDEALEKATLVKSLDASKGYYVSGIVYISEKKFDLAVQELNTALKLDPSLKDVVESLLNQIQKY